MSKSGFTRFLESEAKRNPLRVEGRTNKDEVLREAELLAKRVIKKDLELIRKFWEDKNFYYIAYVLKKYGLEFKGIIHTDYLIKELLGIIERREGLQRSEDENKSG